MLKKKKNYKKDGELINDLDLYDVLAARAFRRKIESKDIMEGNWPKGVSQLSNNIKEQNNALKDHYQKKISPEIVPIIPRLLEDPLDKEQTKLPDNAVYFMNCNYYNIFHFLNIHAASQPMDQEKPEVVVISNPPIVSTPPVGSEDIMQEEKLMEVVELETKKQHDVEVLLEQIKEMKRKIEMQEKERYGKEAVELAKQLQTGNEEEEETSEEPYVKVISEIASEEEEVSQLNALPTPPVYAKAGGQSLENITNLEKFAKVMQQKRKVKQQRDAQEENQAELKKV
uniref:Uncharacterized protein n=1 Tax=Romanomermis culicivorax TaxID=13658 RepID=A0A915JMN0_ROMCU